MGHEARILQAFKANAIGKVLLIDDAYDPPALDGGTLAELATFLDTTEGEGACAAAGATPQEFSAARAAAGALDREDEDLARVHDALYRHFLRDLDPRFDPGGRFGTLKGATLAVLAPLTTLLRRCAGPIDVRLAGLGDGLAVYVEQAPDVVFLDFLLGDDIPPSGPTEEAKEEAARKASIDLLGQILKVDRPDLPAVVLMSSRDMRERVSLFRHDAGGDRIMALRFQFLKKDDIKEARAGLDIQHDAADALLDTTQGFKFGVLVEQALGRWRVGADAAVKELARQIGDLSAKDFAYLFRFRLEREAQPTSDYLHWMFSECLGSIIREKVDWAHDSFRRLDGEPDASALIEGAYDGPSVTVAELFHRIRVEDRRGKDPDDHRFGDVYRLKGKGSVRTVITPDCDLVLRRGRTKVDDVLTMGGTLLPLGHEGSSADDFLLHGREAFSVRWNAKDLRTYPIRGEGSLGRTETLEFVGTLRPIYAQDVQRHALSDLSRIGLSVAPAIGVDGAVSAWIRMRDKGGTRFEALALTGDHVGTVIPGSGDARDGHLVLLRRRTVHGLFDALKAVDRAKMLEDDVDRIGEFLKPSKEGLVYSRLIQKGSQTRKEGPLGSSVAIGSKPTEDRDAAWLQILLTVSASAMEQLATIDPLV